MTWCQYRRLLNSNTENQKNEQRRKEKVQRKEDNVKRAYVTNRHKVLIIKGITRSLNMVVNNQK